MSALECLLIRYGERCRERFEANPWFKDDFCAIRTRDAMVKLYKTDPAMVARLCDGELDRSGALLMYVRDVNAGLL